jgi:hypothetical protein
MDPAAEAAAQAAAVEAAAAELAAAGYSPAAPRPPDIYGCDYKVITPSSRLPPSSHLIIPSPHHHHK